MPDSSSAQSWASVQHLWILVVAGLVAFGIYRRFRRNFGRQRLQPTRMGVRMAILGVIGVLLASTAPRSTAFLGAAAGGALVGALLALWAAGRTRFEMHRDQLHYIPHTVTGIAVFSLFVGRMVYRIFELYSAGAFAGTTPPSMMQSPLTLALFFVLIGYYVVYYGRLLWKSKHLTPADLQDSATAA